MSTFDDIYEVVRAIPRGKVMSYGKVAALSGHPRSARVVGWALHVNPAFGEIPCHRVVTKDGRLSPAFAFGGENVQRRMLEDEGVKLNADGLVDKAYFV